jgi:AcrR family transcriptional regulator
MSTSDARERILATATELFYQHGIHSVGIDLVIARSGVAKMTLYRHFGSKDELVLAFLDRMNTTWMSWLKSRVSARRIRREERPLAVFDALGEWFRTPSFRGCPFIGTAAEFRDPEHPAHRRAWQFKEGLRAYLEELLRDAGYSRSAALADQLLLLADGAIVRAAMEGRADSARAARHAAAVMLGDASSGGDPPKPVRSRRGTLHARR